MVIAGLLVAGSAASTRAQSAALDSGTQAGVFRAAAVVDFVFVDSGVVASIPTRGSLANGHPHRHLLVTDGGFRRDGTANRTAASGAEGRIPPPPASLDGSGTQPYSGRAD